MKEFGLQLWSIADEFTDRERTKRAFLTIAGYGYTQAQTAGTYDFIDPAEFRRYANDAGIRIVGTHYDSDRMMNDIKGTVRYHEILGTREIGESGWWEPENLDVLRAKIRRLNEIAKIYHEEGFEVSYHNHAFEFSNSFRRFEGKRMFDHLLEETDPEYVKFNLDAGWAQIAGMDVRALIESMAGRINILHVKDVQADYPHPVGGTVIRGPERVEVGRGNMNYREIVETAERCGVKYFIVEDEVYSTGNPLESVRMSADYIKANLLD